jgi:hypothetical protein
LVKAADGAAKRTNLGVAMPKYMLLVYEEEVDPAAQAEREKQRAARKAAREKQDPPPAA